MFILGLTGQTGAGKSCAAGVLRQEGFSVIDADAVARRTVEGSASCLRELAAAFGPGILNAAGGLDRKKLAAAAFSGPENVRLLNAVTHPYIVKEIDGELAALKEAGIRYALLDAPALYESGADRLCDKVLAVTAPEPARLVRILKRDSLTREEAVTRMSAQREPSFYTRCADYVVCNEGDLSKFEETIRELAARIRGQA